MPGVLGSLPALSGRSSVSIAAALHFPKRPFGRCTTPGALDRSEDSELQLNHERAHRCLLTPKATSCTCRIGSVTASTPARSGEPARCAYLCVVLIWECPRPTSRAARY
jgi:hypothetical protein